MLYREMFTTLLFRDSVRLVSVASIIFPSIVLPSFFHDQSLVSGNCLDR